MKQLLVFASFLVPSALAHDVRVVESGGAFPTIQSAVDASSAGDVVLVRPGVWVGDVEVLGAGITIVGETATTVRGSIEVSLVPEGESVLIAGLTVRIPNDFQTVLPAPIGAIDVRDCEGAVRIVDCQITGEPGQYDPGNSLYDASGGPGILAARSRDLAVIDSASVGGQGDPGVLRIGGTGGAGVLLDDVANATLMRSVLRGGRGGQNDDGGDGGNGATLSGRTELHVDYSALFGGDGEDAYDGFALTGGDGGHGMVFTGQTIWDFQGVYVGGDFGIGGNILNCNEPNCPGDPGEPYVGPSSQIRPLDGHPSALELPLVVREGESYSRRISAVVGEHFRFERSTATEFGFRPRLRHPRLIGRPAASLFAPQGPITGSGQFGEFIEPRTAPTLPAGDDVLIEWQQATLLETGGGLRRTSARPLIVLRGGL